MHNRHFITRVSLSAIIKENLLARFRKAKTDAKCSFTSSIAHKNLLIALFRFQAYNIARVRKIEMSGRMRTLFYFKKYQNERILLSIFNERILYFYSFIKAELTAHLPVLIIASPFMIIDGLLKFHSLFHLTAQLNEIINL